MADKSTIEWTDATWNPVTGCTKIGPGCDNCYAERFAERWRGIPDHPYEQGFDLRLWPQRLLQPAAWKKPRMIFVNSMSDLFHKNVPTVFVDQVFEAMEQANHHIYQLLTKRSTRLRNYLNRRYADTEPPEYIWCGISVEDGPRVKRIEHLRAAKAGVRFLSVEPLLGPLGQVDLTGIGWVILGGESGPNYRPLKLEWAVEVRDLCNEQGVPFFSNNGVVRGQNRKAANFWGKHTTDIRTAQHDY